MKSKWAQERGGRANADRTACKGGGLYRNRSKSWRWQWRPRNDKESCCPAGAGSKRTPPRSATHLHTHSNADTARQLDIGHLGIRSTGCKCIAMTARCVPVFGYPWVDGTALSLLRCPDMTCRVCFPVQTQSTVAAQVCSNVACWSSGSAPLIMALRQGWLEGLGST